MVRKESFLSLEFQALYLEKNSKTNRPRLLWLSFEVPDRCASSLIYYDLFSETNKSIWKTSDTFLNLPHLGCLEF